MRTFYVITLVLITLLFNAASCNSDDDKDTLPPQTQEGRNTFGCLVNGKIWFPKGVGSRTIAFANKDYLLIGANIGQTESIGLLLKNEELIPNTEYILNSDNSMGTFDIKCSTGAYCYYQTNLKYIGKINIIRLDTINKIISGVFSLNVQTKDLPTNCDCDSNIITITDGRFDLQYLIR